MDVRRRLATRIAILAAPLALLIVAYVWTDPFKVLREHQSYYDDPAVLPNRDVASSRQYLASAPGSYDSYIFGNSRSLAMLSADWQAHLAPGARPFHFDASGETLYGVWTKVRFLSARPEPLGHVFMLVDASLLGETANQKKHLYIKDYSISGDNAIEFHTVFMRGFLADLFFAKYLAYRASGKIHRFAADVLDRRIFSHIPATNDLIFTSEDSAIARAGEAYFNDARRFPPRGPAAPGPAVIRAPQMKMLREIRSALDRKGTDVVVAIPPIYDRKTLHPADLDSLRSVFGSGGVYDFSGDNDLTADVRGFYEPSHFRPAVGREVLRRIYASRQVVAGSR